MVITHGMPSPSPIVAGDAPFVRALHDFDEMPTLRLTTAQAMRLWNLDRPTCQKMLDTLVEARVLTQDSFGQYLKVAG